MNWLCFQCHDTGLSVIAIGTLCGNRNCEHGRLARARALVNAETDYMTRLKLSLPPKDTP